ncbi:hypothetical protein [Streptomyces lydicus]
MTANLYYENLKLKKKRPPRDTAGSLPCRRWTPGWSDSAGTKAVA